MNNIPSIDCIQKTVNIKNKTYHIFIENNNEYFTYYIYDNNLNLFNSDIIEYENIDNVFNKIIELINND